MGVGYTAGPLHKISYLEPVPGSQPIHDPPSFVQHIPNAKWDGRPTQFRSPRSTDIVAWRDRISAKYQSQLGEDLVWDEEADFVDSEDVASSSDGMLRYVAAVLDVRGPVRAEQALVRATRPEAQARVSDFTAAEQRGFTGRFPHLLLGATCWLPYQRHLIIEEPNWEGHPGRFGSTARLADEVKAIRDFIALSDPSATAWTARRYDQPPDVLAAAWQASDTISRLCATAVTRGFPLWYTG